jgi:hypothetical protein
MGLIRLSASAAPSKRRTGEESVQFSPTRGFCQLWNAVWGRYEETQPRERVSADQIRNVKKVETKAAVSVITRAVEIRVQYFLQLVSKPGKLCPASFFEPLSLRVFELTTSETKRLEDLKTQRDINHMTLLDRLSPESCA